MLSNGPMVYLFMLGFAGMLLSSCLTGPADECANYPNRDDLQRRWGAHINNDPGNYDGVSFGVSLFDGTQDIFVEWDNYSIPKRPAILNDVLCATLGRSLDPAWKGDPSVTVSTSEDVALKAMNDVRKELYRQTGESVEIDDCCYILFHDMMLGIGYSPYHKTSPE